MIFKNMEALGLSDVRKVIKVGDTVSDIKEGKNAGMEAVGILEGSSVLGLSKEEFDAFRRRKESTVRKSGENLQGCGSRLCDSRHQRHSRYRKIGGKPLKSAKNLDLVKKTCYSAYSYIRNRQKSGRHVHSSLILRVVRIQGGFL